MTAVGPKWQAKIIEKKNVTRTIKEKFNKTYENRCKSLTVLKISKVHCKYF